MLVYLSTNKTAEELSLFYWSKMIKEFQDLHDRITCLNNLQSALCRLYFKDLRNKVYIRANVLCYKQLEKLLKELKDKQKKCQHKFEYVGHSHIYDDYQCIYCNEQDER